MASTIPTRRWFPSKIPIVNGKTNYQQTNHPSRTSLAFTLRRKLVQLLVKVIMLYDGCSANFEQNNSLYNKHLYKFFCELLPSKETDIQNVEKVKRTLASMNGIYYLCK